MTENVSRINSQELYDSFNSFIMSRDRGIFGKLIARTLVYETVSSVPGDIVECGVFKGSGMYTFLKLKQIFNPNSIKKVIGFDFFNAQQLLDSIKNPVDRETMSGMFTDRKFIPGVSYSYTDYLSNKLVADGFSPEEFMLVEGDISYTSEQFVLDHPGFKISLLYIDLDTDVPTYNTLINLWDRMTIGGKVVFDEYANHDWSESKGVDRFIEERCIQIHSIDCSFGGGPTAYIIKE